MPVVAQHQFGDAALRVALEGEAGGRGAVDVKEHAWGLGGKFGDLALQVLLVELVGLTEDGDDGVAVLVEILAGERVEDRRGQLDGGRVEGDY